ncbi:hypothetical protein H4Q26_006261 [Puccinia striiformis f. sp. tritici PST-130]|nr:hypothetical protein H4Q26_006261 [Puccinia striiformis f. sp. tritici PST-130]
MKLAVFVVTLIASLSSLEVFGSASLQRQASSKWDRGPQAKYQSVSPWARQETSKSDRGPQAKHQSVSPWARQETFQWDRKPQAEYQSASQGEHQGE